MNSSNELFGLQRVAAAIKKQVNGESAKPTTPKAATPSQMSEFETQLRRVLDKAPRAEQGNLDRLWRQTFDANPSNCILMLRGVK